MAVSQRLTSMNTGKGSKKVITFEHRAAKKGSFSA